MPSPGPLAEDLDFILLHTRDLWEELRDQRIFITGGTGFFGCWLLESFAWANDKLNLNASAPWNSRECGFAISKKNLTSTRASGSAWTPPGICAISNLCGKRARPRGRHGKRFMSRKIFITGGSGFIGRNLVEQLGTSFEVLAPTHAELELMEEDAVRHFFRDHIIDVVIHCATKPGHRNAKDPTGLIYSNTLMFFNLVRNADRFRKMILLTSGTVYDMRYYLPKMTEDYFDVHVPVDETGYSKYLCAKYAEHLDNVVELRPFGVFGKYEDWQIRFISNMICKALFDLPLTIKQNRRFDYIHVGNLVKVIRYFIDHKSRYKAYNVTPDQAVEMKTIAEKVLEISGKNLEIRISAPEMGMEYSGSNERLKAESPDVELSRIDPAIAGLYRWYDAHRHILDRERLLIDK